jgi:hypothetical protein
MRTLLLAASLLAAAGPASGECPPADFHYAPSYPGPFKSYGYPTAFRDPITQARSVSGKTGRICPDCSERRRGVQLVSRGALAGGFFQYPVPIAGSVCISAHVDISRMAGEGAFAGIELDSPAVPIDTLPLTYVFVGVDPENGVWIEASGESVGAALMLPEGTQTVVVELRYSGGTLDVLARPLQEPTLTPVVEDFAFALAGSAGLGAGAFDLGEGDRAGFGAEISGDIYAAPLQAVLGEIAALLVLQDGAVADLDGALPADARAKLAEAQGRLDPALLGAVGALPPSQARANALKRLAKAAAKDAQAQASIDTATPEGLAAARAAVQKAKSLLLRAERVLEIGVAAEAKPPPGV